MRALALALASPNREPKAERHFLPNKSRNLTFTVLTDKKPRNSSPRAGDCSELRKPSLENPDGDVCGRHFLFDKRWRNGIHYENNFRDEVLMAPVLPPVSQEYSVRRSQNLTRFSLRKQPFYGIAKPHSHGSSEGHDLPSVLLTVTTPPTSGRRSITFTDSFKNRSRVNNRVCRLLAAGFNHTSQSFPDPVLGAPALFLQRISEMSSLEEETARQEKIKNLRKIRRQET